MPILFVLISDFAGFSFRFSLRLNILSIQSFIPDSAKGTIDGLLGHFDGDASNDLMDRNGNVVCIIGYDNCTVETIHYQFGETCMLCTIITGPRSYQFNVKYTN